MQSHLDWGNQNKKNKEIMAIWIDQDFFTEKTGVDSNADFDKIVPFIEQAQDLDLMPWLGSYLYNTMNDHIEAKIDDDTEIPEAYKTLLDTYILKCLPYFTLSRLSMPLKLKYAANGIVSKTPENTQSADTADIQKMDDVWKNTAQQYLKRMVDFLQLNSSTYPEYLGSDGTAYQIYPRTDAYDCPIYLGGSSRSELSDYYNSTWNKRGY